MFGQMMRGQYFDRKVTLSELEIAFSWMKKCLMPTSAPFTHLLFVFPFPSWTYLVLWLTRYPRQGGHGGLSAAYFPIAVMRSVSQVPSRPPTFPLYKARSPGSVTAPGGKLWNRTAGLVSGRAESAVRLLLIPYYPASPSSLFFFFSFSYHHITSPSIFYSKLPLPGHSLSLSLCQVVREKRMSSCVDTKRNLCFKRGSANTPDSSSCSANCLSVSLVNTFQKREKKAKEKTVYILPAFMPAGICTICPSCWPRWPDMLRNRYFKAAVSLSVGAHVTVQEAALSTGFIATSPLFKAAVMRSTTCWTYFQSKHAWHALFPHSYL